MNPASRTEAHKIFASLYRKKRSPEHQQLIDDAITRSNDVFIRIDLIKKIDEEQERKERIKEEPAQTESKIETSKSSSMAGNIGNPKPMVPKNQTSAQIPAVTDNSGGFMDKLFGGGNNIAKFAKETKTLELGLFARKPTISKNVEKIFRSLKEDEIISTIQALKYSEQVGWRIWTPLVYNVVLNYNRFFNTFISLDSLFRDEISAEVFLGRSTKMQMYYARILNRPDTKEIIMDKVPALIKTEAKLYPKIESILTGLNYGLTLESRKPSLTDAIVAFHVVMTKKLVPWTELEKTLNVSPIDERKFNATQEVTKQIELATAKLSNDIQSKLNIKDELDFLKKNYFSFGEGGKLSFEFLNLIIDDYVAHYYAENMQTDVLKSNFKNTPHKLLQLVCRDLQSNYIPLVEGYVKLDLNQVKDVLIMQIGLFFPEIDRMNNILRTLDAFNRKFPSFQYGFQNYSEHLTKGTQDQIESQLLKVLTEGSDFFHKFATKMTTVIENHMLALSYEESGQINEKTLLTKEKVIEEIKIMQRFIPFADGKMVSQNRLAGKTVFQVLFEMTRLLYNYAVIFKDGALLAKLGQSARNEAELQKLYSDYERLTSKPYTITKQD
ncbi:MAG: hypothetical protein KBA66_05060 [Leptospiraceae bacterium]|nr:hypothetical protein [Leptospiraceae bacterium]